MCIGVALFLETTISQLGHFALQPIAIIFEDAVRSHLCYDLCRLQGFGLITDNLVK